jgi:hypothetical protein
MARRSLAAVGLVSVLLLVTCREPQLPPDTTGSGADGDGNDQCFVCHLPFVPEKLALAHAKKKVWCSRCHGPSAKHMQDEDIGATPPEIVFKKHQIDAYCGTCHQSEKHPKVSPETRQKRFAEGKAAQEKIKGRPVNVTGVCTDCHGAHWIPPKDKKE